MSISNNTLLMFLSKACQAQLIAIIIIIIIIRAFVRRTMSASELNLRRPVERMVRGVNYLAK